MTADPGSSLALASIWVRENNCGNHLSDIIMNLVLGIRDPQERRLSDWSACRGWGWERSSDIGDFTMRFVLMQKNILGSVYTVAKWEERRRRGEGLLQSPSSNYALNCQKITINRR